MNRLTVINPANNQVLDELEMDTPETIAVKFNKAKQAQKKWAKISPEKRVECILRFREIMLRKKNKLALILTSEVGKPISQSLNELNGLLARIDFFDVNVSKVIADELVLDDKKQNIEEKIVHEPLGVIANISAWNYPYFVGSNVFIPALLTGNAVLYKPSEFSCLTGLAISDMLHEAGIPEDIFIPVIGRGEAGAALLEQNLNGVFFTGSYPTGRKIAQEAARNLIKVQLELGGKDPCYVADDVNVEATAAGVADGAFYNNGQSCCAVERIYVHSRIYDEFVSAFVETVKGFVTGEPMDEKTYIGALARRELAVEFLEKQVKDAVDKGAKLLLGGKKVEGPGYFFEPTVFTDVDHSMDLMREETFGPLIGIQRVEGDEEAVSLMNDTNYGLTASVYTNDKDRAAGILSEVNSGTVYWNCCDRISPRLPWSGRGHSGIGSTLSTYGIQAFVQPKAWHLKRVTGAP
jgi:acyl-CoA reductase-like NAD-dependent aldehyde dehydrogenase